LPDCRKTDLKGDIFCDPVQPSHPLEACCCQNDAVQAFLGKFSNPGVEIPPQLDHLKILPKMEELCLAAETAGADPGPLPQFH
jgi:hypothetical protein